MTAADFMLLFAGIAGPWLVALLRRRSWDADAVTLVAAAVPLAAYLFGQLADGTLAWPLPADFWRGLAAAYGLNQAGYQVAKRLAPSALQQVEEL